MPDVRTLYREHAAQGASPVRQVVMLYEQVVEDLRRAMRSIESNEIETRTSAINHAITVIAYLQSRLNMEGGGDVARNVSRFYDVVRARLLEAQFQSSREILNEQVALLLEVRDAWIEVERAETARPPAAPTQTVEAPASEALRVRLDWRG